MEAVANALASETLTEVYGVGLEDMLGLSVPDLGDFSSEACWDTDGSFSEQPQKGFPKPISNGSQEYYHHAPLPSSPQRLSSSVASHDDFHQTLPSIFADVDLSSLRAEEPSQAHGHGYLGADHHAGQTESREGRLKLDAPGMSEQPWSTAHVTELANGQIPHAERSAHLHGPAGVRSRPSHTWGGMMTATAASQARGSAAQAAARAPAEQTRALAEANRHKQCSSSLSRPLVVQQESELVCLLHSLAQPATSRCVDPLAGRLPTLREINRLRGVAARTAKYKALYYRNLWVSLPTPWELVYSGDLMSHRWILTRLWVLIWKCSSQDLCSV